MGHWRNTAHKPLRPQDRKDENPKPTTITSSAGLNGSIEVDSIAPSRTNVSGSHLQSQAVVPFTRSNSHCSERLSSFERPWDSVSLNTGATSMASTAQDGWNSSDSSIVDEHQRPTRNGTLRGYWAEVVEQNELSLAERFRAFYHVHDSPAKEIQQHLTGYRADTPRTSHPTGGDGQDTPSFGDSPLENPISSRPDPGSDPGNDTCPDTESTAYPTYMEAARTSKGKNMNAKPDDGAPVVDNQDYFIDEDYELLSRTEMDAVRAEYSYSVDWLSTNDPNAEPFMPLIPFALTSTDPFKEHARNTKADIKRVAQLRQSVRYLRFDIQDQKSHLQRKEQELFNEIEKYIKSLREQIVGYTGRTGKLDPNYALVSRLFAVSQSNRNECGPLIDKIGSLEERLAAEEAKLSQAENTLHKSLGISLGQPEPSLSYGEVPTRMEDAPAHEHSEDQYIVVNNKDVISNEDEYSDADSYPSNSSFFSRANYHPLYVEYQERVGDQGILRERYAWLLHDKRKLEAEQETRQRVGLGLQITDQAFLQDFAEIAQPIEVELAEVQNDVRRLRALCLEQGIVDESDNYVSKDQKDHDDEGTVSALIPTPPPANSNVSNENVALQTIRTPPTLQTPLEHGIREPLDEKVYQDRINPWLLAKLSCSKSEIALFATIVRVDGNKLDGDTAGEALKYWHIDGAGDSVPQRPKSLDFWTMRQLRNSTLEILKAGYDRALVRNLFGIPLWGKGKHDHEDKSMTYLMEPE